MGEDVMFVFKLRSVRRIRESILWEGGLIGVSGERIYLSERQCDVWS